MNTTSDYSNSAAIKKSIIKNIAPNYFNFENVNNYNVGVIGMALEIMATAIEDGKNATNITKREFYPATAQFTSSLYKMAAIQNIDIPMVTPASAKAGLLIDQQAVIDNSTYSNGVYTCVIDSVLKIMADNLQFMLDYPIIILSKKAKSGWTHTIHYDISVTNSLNKKDDARYISSKIIKNNGTSFILMMIDTIRQVEMTSVSNLVIKDNTLEATAIDVDFDGNLANFEVFYTDNQSTSPQQLQKVLVNGPVPSVPFCYYDIINERKIRISFPVNSTFSPAFNSEIVTNVYTSAGSEGNFTDFGGSLVCSSTSEKYQYNSNLTITGLINGASSGGKDVLSADAFKNSIIDAYSTNKTITTSNDLQIYFDSISDDVENMRVLFRKKRDDALVRLFGAYVLLKDNKNNVVPTNTLDAVMKRSEVMELTSNSTRVMVKPGTLFEYNNPTDPNDFSVTTVADGTVITDDLDQTRFFFTNPFLIGINTVPNIIGYYLNSIDSTYSIEYSFVNDLTENQFMAKNIKIHRNAILGANYYEISVNIASAASNIDADAIGTISDPTIETNLIRAKQNGRVLSTAYIFRDDNGFIETVVKYADETTEAILSSNYTALKVDTVDEFEYITGYTMQFEVGTSFLENDILGIKKDVDLGKLRIVADLSGYLYVNKLYVPLVIDKIDPLVGGFTFKGYIATDDMVDLNSQIVITHGIITSTGVENDNLAIPMNSLRLELSAFYDNDDKNFEHKYSSYEYLKAHTLTNTYITPTDEPIDFIKEIDFIRSVLDFERGESEADYKLKLFEMPLLDANWSKLSINYNYFVNRLYSTYQNMRQAYFALENNYNIDMKFYNTFGRARFYKVGITNNISPLNSVNCSFSFGVNLITVTNQESFVNKFRLYVKDYLESVANATTAGQNVYILNMIADIKKEFTEIGYIEYYGFNIYDHTAQKIIGPDMNEYQNEYIPEFINIHNAIGKNGVPYPDILVTLLDN